ncbi:hypothetical protein ACFSCX_19085 [Bacillus salitolerans]|uniref:Uncharacterized protein n=1 Tax=Bacillus salitolerans TaxID=1437434 RepID=A0ABW4LWU6_9BACI
MSYKENSPFCNPHKDQDQNILFENETCYLLQHNKQQDVLEGCAVIVPKEKITLMPLSLIDLLFSSEESISIVS